MANRGIPRSLFKHGIRTSRLVLDGTNGAVETPFHLTPQATPTGTAAEGDFNVNDAANVLEHYDGTQWRKFADRYVITQRYNAPVDEHLFVADRAYKVLSMELKPTVAGTDAGAVTMQLVKVTGVQAPSAGAALTTATFDLKGTVHTTQTATNTATAANLLLADGNGIAWDITGTPTAAVGVVTIVLEAV